MNMQRAVLKYRDRYYHNYYHDSWDVHKVAPGEYSSGYFIDKGGTYLSLYNESGTYICRVHASRIKALRINEVALWEVFNPGLQASEGLSLIISSIPSENP